MLNADGTKPYGLFFTIPAERFEPASAPEVRFMETAAGMPAAIKTWWYPGERTGYEFIYPKEQARRLAMGASQPVLTTQAQTTTTEQTNTADLSRVASSGQETQLNDSAAPTAATPTGGTQEGQIASSSISIPTINSTGRECSPRRPRRVCAAGRTQLPRTASQLPLVAMVGTVALVSATLLKFWGRDSVNCSEGRASLPARRSPSPLIGYVPAVVILCSRPGDGRECPSLRDCPSSAHSGFAPGSARLFLGGRARGRAHHGG